MTEKLLAIDPGDDRTHSNMGWARFWGGYFVDAGEANPRAILQHIISAQTIVCEHPEVYRSRHMKGDPNDLARLIQQIGIIKGLAWASGAEPVFVDVLPKSWKGQVPKHICHERALSVWTKQDCPPPPRTQLNAWDAIALGLWYLHRTSQNAVLRQQTR